MECTWKIELRTRQKLPAAGEACMATCWPPGCKGWQLGVFNTGDRPWFVRPQYDAAGAGVEDSLSDIGAKNRTELAC